MANPLRADMVLRSAAANTGIYYTNDFNPQKLGCNLRNGVSELGQKNTVTYINFICEDTVDEK